MRELWGEQRYLYGGLGMGEDKGLPSEVIEKLKEEGDAVLHVYPGGHTCIHVRMAGGQGEEDPNRMRAEVYESVLRVYLRDCRLEEDVLRLSTLDLGRGPTTGEMVVEAFAAAVHRLNLEEREKLKVARIEVCEARGKERSELVGAQRAYRPDMKIRGECGAAPMDHGDGGMDWYAGQEEARDSGPSSGKWAGVARERKRRNSGEWWEGEQEQWEKEEWGWYGRAGKDAGWERGNEKQKWNGGGHQQPGWPLEPARSD